MKELCKRGFHFFLLPTHTFTLPLINSSIPHIVFSFSLLYSLKITTVFSFVLLIAFHQSHFFLLFYSILSILCPSFFSWQCSRFTHPRTHTHTNSLTLIFSGVEFCNSTLGVWQCPNRNGMREKQPLQGLAEMTDYFSSSLCQRAPSDS